MSNSLQRSENDYIPATRMLTKLNPYAREKLEEALFIVGEAAVTSTLSFVVAFKGHPVLGVGMGVLSAGVGVFGAVRVVDIAERGERVPVAKPVRLDSVLDRPMSEQAPEFRGVSMFAR